MSYRTTPSNDTAALARTVTTMQDHHDTYATTSEGVIPTRLLEGLDPSQRVAVTTLDGPVLVVAGPGSGKTRVLTHRIAALIESGRAKPWEILAVTFTNKAAAEMRERTHAIIGDAAHSAWVSTFHATCARILRTSHDEAGLGANFTIVDADDSQRIMRGVLVELGLPSESSDVREASALISSLRNTGLDASSLTVHGRPELVGVRHLYEQRLNELGAVDFDGLLVRTEELLRTRPDVAERYRRRFRYVMVDEYQDTNVVQYRITRILAAGQGNICVVGDFDQSIYAWRGATPTLMAGFTDDYPEATVISLGTNYRSTPEIVAVCRSVIAPNPAVHRATLRTGNASGLAVRLLSCADDRDEAATVVGELADLPAGSTGAILLRTNAQSRAFEEELARRRIGYGVVGALRFYDRAEVKDALSWLRVALNNRDQLSFARAAAVPRRGLGSTTIDLLVERARRDSLPVVDAARVMLAEDVLPTRARGPVEGFIADIDAVDTAARSGGPYHALQVVLSTVGLRAHHDGDGPQAAGRVENLDALLGGARDYPGPDPYTTTALFLENSALVSAADSDTADKEVDDAGSEPELTVQPVLIMTAHASKGKEFDWVYVCGVEEGLFPLSHGEEEPDDVDEERRLLFVACSRARRRLTLTHCRRRMRYGQVTTARLSSFASSLPEEVVRTATPASNGSHAFTPRYGHGEQPRPITRSARRTGRRGIGPRLSASQAVPGARVRHASFGEGVVESLHDGVDPTVVVRFGAGLRSLSLDLAPLELIAKQ